MSDANYATPDDVTRPLGAAAGVNSSLQLITGFNLSREEIKQLWKMPVNGKGAFTLALCHFYFYALFGIIEVLAIPLTSGSLK